MNLLQMNLNCADRIVKYT